MANPLQQAAVRRKVIYVAVIIGLFTISLFWRGKFDVPFGNPARAAADAPNGLNRFADTLARQSVAEQSRELELRELEQGDPEVAADALRLSLVGSRGLVVTGLWWAALEKQKRNEWHQLEMLVKLVTRLQPNFITPWMFQSWNLAYNVSVENDKLGDMYYYIARGIDLLAQGDRLNTKEYRGKVLGSPEMRDKVGFYYQNKFGVSDKVQTLRSLAQLSVIPPDERNPAILTPPSRPDPDYPDRVIVTPWAEHKPWVDFCKAHPQLLWRLRNKLDLVNPEQIVQFLKDNDKIPTRYLATGELAPPNEQFPALPPRFNTDDYDPTVKRIPDDTYDPFHAARAWHNYAMTVVPPAVTWPEGTSSAGQPIPWTTPKPGVDFDEFAYRLPRQPAYIIFTQHPARAQSYLAERLGKEGWFDAASGWAPDARANPSDYWLKVEPDDPDVVLSTPASSQQEYQKAYTMWREHGEKHALELTRPELYNLDNLAQPVRSSNLTELSQLTPEEIEQNGWTPEEVMAKKAKVYYVQNRSMTNFPYFLASSEAEQADVTIAARQLLWRAERAAQVGENSAAIELYVAGLAKFRQALIAFPQFYRPGRSDTTEEQLYEYQIQLTDLLRDDVKVRDRADAIGLATRAVAPGLADVLSADLLQMTADDEASTRVALVAARDNNAFQARLWDAVRYDAAPIAIAKQDAAYALAGFGAGAPGQSDRVGELVTRQLATDPDHVREVLNADFAWMKSQPSENDPEPWVRQSVKDTVLGRLGRVRTPTSEGDNEAEGGDTPAGSDPAN